MLLLSADRLLMSEYLTLSGSGGVSLLLLFADRLLMSEYLTLSGSGAVPLLSPVSASVNSSSVIRLSFGLASARVLSSPLQTAFLSSGLL